MENPHGRAENWTRELVISNQKLWPLDHEGGQILKMNLKWEVDLTVYQHLVLRPSYVSEKVGVN